MRTALTHILDTHVPSKMSSVRLKSWFHMQTKRATRKCDVPTSSVTGSDFNNYVGRHTKSADRHIINTLQILSAAIPAPIRDLVPYLTS